MKSTRLLLQLILVVAILVTALSCASSEPKSDLELDFDTDEIRLAISEQAARGLMEELIGADLECEGEIDDPMKSLLEKLDAGGPRARASYRDSESTVDGRRRGGKLDLEIRGAGSGKIDATMPWAIAECMLGNNTSIEKTVTSSIRVKVTNEDGRNFSFKLQ